MINICANISNSVLRQQVDSSGPPSNTAPYVGIRSSTIIAGVIYIVYEYIDDENDIENNGIPRVENFTIGGDPVPGETLTAIEGTDWDFVSPSNYSEGATTYQWYTKDEDGTNKQNIVGETTDSYVVQTEDQGKIIGCDITPIQVAVAVDANGNPTGNTTSAEIFVAEAFLLSNYYNHVMDLNEASWDDANRRILDVGLDGGSNYFSSPDANSKPTLAGTAPNEYLQFDPTGNIEYLNFANVASGNRTIEWVGRMRADSIAALRTFYANLSTLDFAATTGTKWRVRDSQTFTSTGNALVGSTFSFRIRASSNGTVVTLRIQINKNTSNETFALDETLVLTNNGVALGAGTSKLGASTTPSNGLLGRIHKFGMRVQSHLTNLGITAADNSGTAAELSLINDMWDHLNSVS